MPHAYSSKCIIKVLLKKGFFIVSQKGSHIKLRKITHRQLIVIVPANKKIIPLGTFRSILSQSDCTEDDFKK